MACAALVASGFVNEHFVFEGLRHPAVSLCGPVIDQGSARLLQLYLIYNGEQPAPMRTSIQLTCIKH